MMHVIHVLWSKFLDLKLKCPCHSRSEIRALNGHFKDLPDLWVDLPVVKGGHYLHGTSTANAENIRKEVRR